VAGRACQAVLQCSSRVNNGCPVSRPTNWVPQAVASRTLLTKQSVVHSATVHRPVGRSIHMRAALTVSSVAVYCKVLGVHHTSLVTSLHKKEIRSFA
jgi:hypothetical protein